MNREKFQNALHLTGEFLAALGVFAFPFVAIWAKYIFWD